MTHSTPAPILRPPHQLTAGPGLFLAGLIPSPSSLDWRRLLGGALTAPGWTLIDPYNPDYDPSDPGALSAQVAWERRHQVAAAAMVFWFDGPSVCPITLFELGAWLHTDKPLVVGASLNYPRRPELICQLQQAPHRGQTLSTSLRELIEQAQVLVDAQSPPNP